jgi:flagellar hook assembly protein FlgD
MADCVENGSPQAMTFSRVLVAALLAAALGAPPASGGVRLVARDQPITTGRSPAREAPLRFNMVGLHWQGSGPVSFRTRLLDGTWSGWQPARPEAEDRPDRGSPERAARRGWKLGNLYWTGPSDGIQYRVGGEATRLRAFFLWSPVREETRTVARAGRPDILSRAEWGADESIVRASPYYADRVRFAVVHHTAGTNSYSASESAAIVRGIQRYHVLANGWNDIGYNFLVDKYGQVFEGRGGGIDRPVVGAHAEGFNTGSTGVSVLGTYSASRISKDARSALVRLLAWRLDVAHVDPTSRLTWISGGNPEYPAGTAVRLRAISGHRDTGPTTCPGASLYAQLPGIAADVEARGLPKLYDPSLTGKLGGLVRITGRLSESLPWTVTIRDESGAAVATGSGTGARVDWTWDAAATPFGDFTYTVAAGPDVRPWTAAVPGPPRLVVDDLTVAPRVVVLDKAGEARAAEISFELTTSASVTVDVLAGDGARVRRLLGGVTRPAGKTKLSWGGRDGDRNSVASGRYTVRVSATSPGQTAAANRAVFVDWTLSYLRLEPRPISPNGDGRRDALIATFELNRPADVRLRVFRGATVVRRLALAALNAGTHAYEWNGRNREGERVRDGAYLVQVEATTDLGTRTHGRGFAVDTRAPTVKIVSASAAERTRVVLEVNEAARLEVRFGSQGTVWKEVAAGRSAVSWDGVVRRVEITASDAAENGSATLTARVRRS